ncbi:hypothetical protein SUGI_0068500 [Cryptomeria japonica]|nr:hypothetical protein SUGI_0068500 [Cryptomeria japonica]
MWFPDRIGVSEGGKGVEGKGEGWKERWKGGREGNERWIDEEYGEGIRDVRKEVEGDGNGRRYKWEWKKKMKVEVERKEAWMARRMKV